MGKMYLPRPVRVDSVQVGDEFLNEKNGTVHKCVDIKLMENKWMYGYYNDCLDSISWVSGRFVKPYTIESVIFG